MPIVARPLKRIRIEAVEAPAWVGEQSLKGRGKQMVVDTSPPPKTHTRSWNPVTEGRFMESLFGTALDAKAAINSEEQPSTTLDAACSSSTVSSCGHNQPTLHGGRAFFQSGYFKAAYLFETALNKYGAIPQRHCHSSSLSSPVSATATEESDSSLKDDLSDDMEDDEWMNLREGYQAPSPTASAVHFERP